MTERCFDCRFFRNFSECHRHAPFTNTGFDTRLVPRANWPNVHGDDWCGDFQSSSIPAQASFDAEIAELEASAPPTPADLPADFDASVLYDDDAVRSPEVEEAGEAQQVQKT